MLVTKQLTVAIDLGKNTMEVNGYHLGELYYWLDQGSRTQLTWGPLEVESGSGWATLSFPQKKGFHVFQKKERNLLNLYY